MLRPWDAAAFRGHDVSSFSLVVVDQFHIEGVFSSNRKTMRQFARTVTDQKRRTQLGLRTETSDL